MAKTKLTINIPLKVAIYETGKTQQQIAIAARVSETRLSHMVRGRHDGTERERNRLARTLAALGASQPAVEVLFPNSETIDTEAIA